MGKRRNDSEADATVVTDNGPITRVQRFRTTGQFDAEHVKRLLDKESARRDQQGDGEPEESGEPVTVASGFDAGNTVSEVDALRNLTGAPLLETDGGARHDFADRYEEVSTLGQGGMGDVLLVHDKVMDRDVAMKRLRTARSESPEHIAALRREARIIGSLEHPAIIPVYDIGERDDGTTYYTMKLVDHTTLGEVVARLQIGDKETESRFGIRRLVGIFKQIAQGLQYAHGKGVVHRDLKPENILIGELGEVQVMDWGIAKRLSGSRPAGAEGLIVGTPAYMSPEQAAGQDSRVDSRSDIYSLGVMLYEVLALQRPYGGETGQQTLEAVKNITPLSPVTVARERNVPPELADLAMRMLHKQPDDRPATMSEVADALERFLAGEEERARRRERADGCHARALDEMQRYEEMKVEREFLLQEEAYLARVVRPWDEQSAKQQLWALRHRLQVLDVLYAHSFGIVTELLRQAVDAVDHEQARQLLIRLYWDRHDEAEAHEDSATKLFFARLAHELEAEELEAAGMTAGWGTLQVRSQPSGAVVYAIPFAEYRADHGGISPQYEIGVTPIVGCRLPVGPYILIARLDGHRDAQEATYVREQHHDLLLLCDPWTSSFPLTGREVELARLWTLLDDIEVRSRPLTCLISGPAGMGKNLLLDAFRAQVKQHPIKVFVLLEVTCQPIRRDLPYAVLVEMIRLRAAVQETDTAASAREKLWRMVTAAFTRFGARQMTEREEGEARNVADTIAALPAFDIHDPARTALHRNQNEAGRRAMTEALATYFQRLAMCKPVLILVRNAQFMDHQSRAFFSDLSKLVAGAPILVVGTASDFEESAAPRASLARRAAGGSEPLVADVHLSLKCLSDDALDQLVRGLLSAPVNPKLLAWLREHAAGNPFLAAELIAVLAVSGGIEFSHAEWRLVRERSPTLEPNSISAAVHELIDTLPEHVRAVFAAAVVVGRVFWHGALQMLGLNDVDESLQMLVQRGFITRTATSRYDHEPEYRLSSSLRWRVAYDMLPPRKRRGYHRRVAAWMAEQGRQDLEEALHIAYHLEMGGQPEDAAIMLARTGLAAAQVGALEEAMSLYKRVHVLTDDPRIQDDAEKALHSLAVRLRKRRRRKRPTLLG